MSTGGGSSAPQLLRNAIDSYEATLTTQGRKQIKKGNFALPEQKAYPIHDISHARNALARVAQHGTPEEQKKVKAAAYAKYPSLKKESDARPMLPGARILEAAQAPAGEGPRIKIVLIDEGLGNRRNMNYYSPEAIASAAKVFEGKPCFMDHPSETEESDLPERTVRKQVGYYKGLHVEKLKSPQTGEMVDACVGELHFDLSEAGREAHAKALTALHFQKEFPGSALQYVGWSVLGDGKAETKVMEIDGEELEVHYVTEFTEGDSCDMVTKAGRGGRALVAIAESAHGSKEDGMNKLKKLLAKMQEAAKKAEGDAKKGYEQAVKTLEAEIKALTKSREDGEGEGADAEEAEGDMKAMCAKREGESDEDHKSRLHKMAKHLAGMLDAKKEDDSDGDGDGDADDQEPPKKQESDREASLYAVKAYIAEAGVDEDVYDEAELKQLARLPFREAKRQIDKDARLVESATKKISGRVPVALLRGGAREDGAEETGRGNATLKESFKKED